MCSDRPKQWDLCLAPAEFPYNNMVYRSTGKTPFFVVYQKPPNHTLDLVSLPKIPSYNIAAKNFVEKIEAIQADVRLELEASNAKYKEDRDKHRRTKIYAEDDLVMDQSRHYEVLQDVVENAILVRDVRGGEESAQLSRISDLLDTVVLSNMGDCRFWDLNSDGCFRVKDVCRMLEDMLLPKSDVPSRWVKQIPIKVNVLAWKISMDRLPTRVNLHRRGVQVKENQEKDKIGSKSNKNGKRVKSGKSLKQLQWEDPLEDPPKVPMADNRTMAELLQAPIEGYEDAIVIPEIAANNFELKHNLINLVQNKQFFGHDKEDPHAHIPRIWLEKEPPRSILTWDDLVTKFINQFFPPSKTTNLHNEITRFQQRFDESFYEALDRFNDLLRACLHHGFSKLHQLDTFYNALNVNDQDSLNSAAGGNFLDKMPRECLKIIESKSKVRQSRAKAVVSKVSTSSSTPAISFEVAELKDMVRALLLDKKNQSSAPAPSPTPAPVKAVEPNCVTCGGAHSYQNCLATSENVYQDNIQDGVSYQGPTIPTPSKVVKQGTEVTKDQVQTLSSQSTTPVQPPIVQSETQTPVSKSVVAPVSAPMPNLKPSIPYPSRRDNERCRDQANEQIEKFYEIFKDMSFEISFTDAGGPHVTFQCQPLNQNFYELNHFYNSNSFGFDQSQPPQFPIIHPPPQETSIENFHDQENELAEYINTPGWNRPAFCNNGDDDDDDCT
nr:hypothetical protein [Tanacetum cinerariifolium]